jgi:hypothetical protein
MFNEIKQLVLVLLASFFSVTVFSTSEPAKSEELGKAAEEIATLILNVVNKIEGPNDVHRLPYHLVVFEIIKDMSPTVGINAPTTYYVRGNRVGEEDMLISSFTMTITEEKSFWEHGIERSFNMTISDDVDSEIAGMRLGEDAIDMANILLDVRHVLQPLQHDDMEIAVTNVERTQITSNKTLLEVHGIKTSKYGDTRKTFRVDITREYADHDSEPTYEVSFPLSLKIPQICIHPADAGL